MTQISIYDSTQDTLKHIENINLLLECVIIELNDRAKNHDRSKLLEPEKSGFDKYTLKLKEVSYGSSEYNQYLKELNNVLEHHYLNNRHHPEHFDNGIRDMTLIDLIEMLSDWKAATLKHKDGNINKSLNINKKRFNISDDLYAILKNTIEYLNWQD